METKELITLLTPVVSTFITWLAKVIVGKLPKWVLPIISSLVGGLAVSATQYLAGLQSPQWYIGLILGLAGVGLHELGQKISESGTENIK